MTDQAPPRRTLHSAILNGSSRRSVTSGVQPTLDRKVQRLDDSPADYSLKVQRLDDSPADYSLNQISQNDTGKRN